MHNARLAVPGSGRNGGRMRDLWPASSSVTAWFPTSRGGPQGCRGRRLPGYGRQPLRIRPQEPGHPWPDFL